MKFLEVFNKKIGIITPIIFIILTFFYSILRTPFFDEAYAYLISNLSLGEIFHLTRIEGHPVLWYLILKLTTINQNLYPYNILITNWIISSVLIVFLWKKAPFNNIIKLLITFSYPFFNYFGIIARPYGLSVLALFLLAYYFKKSEEKPLLYSFLIIFCANITAMSAIGAVGFCIIFIYNIIKAKLNLIKPLSILSLGFITLLAQFINVRTPVLKEEVLLKSFILSAKKFILISISNNLFQNLFHILGIILFFATIILLFKKAKQALFILLTSYFLTFLLFIKIYTATSWHYYFIFIYLIIALWLSWEKIKNNRILNIFLILYLLFSLIPYSYFKTGQDFPLNTKNYKPILEFILNDKNLTQNSKLFNFDWFSPFSPGLLPYLNQENIKIYDIEGYDKTTYNSIKNTYNYRNSTIEGKKIIKNLDKNKTNYLITQGYFLLQGNTEKYIKFDNSGFIYEKENIKLKFQTYKSNPILKIQIFKIIPLS